MNNKTKFNNLLLDKFCKLMEDIAYIYERFISISIRGVFDIDNKIFEGIKICLNPTFWPHSFNFKKIDYKKKNKNIMPNPLGKKWNNSLKWINKKLDDLELPIQEKKNIFINWVKSNNELWNKTRSLWNIKDYYDIKFYAWNTLILFLNKYNENKSNLISDKKIFNLYKIDNYKKESNYNSDYILVINDLYDHNIKNNNYILVFCVVSSVNDLNIKLTDNPTKYENKVNYLFLTLKSIQIRNNYKFNESYKLIYTNIFLNERWQ